MKYLWVIVIFSVSIAQNPPQAIDSVLSDTLEKIPPPIEEKVEIQPVILPPVDVDENIPKTQWRNRRALGVIFGIENYREIPDVPYADEDATIVKEYFQNVLGIPEEHIYFRINETATLAEFRKVFYPDGWLEKRIIPTKTDVFFYFSGHGMPDYQSHEGYLAPHDSDPNFPKHTGVRLATLYKYLGDYRARSVILFWDACFTGGTRNQEMLIQDSRAVFIDAAEFLPKTVTLMTAASGYEPCSVYEEKRHGLFTYFLLQGLQNYGNTDGDRFLRVGELYDYIRFNVSQTALNWDLEQNPTLTTPDEYKILIDYKANMP